MSKSEYKFNVNLIKSTTNLLKTSHLQDYFCVDKLKQQQKIIGQSHGRGISYFIDASADFGCNAVLRHYWRGGFMAKINPDLFLSKGTSRAEDEYNLLNFMYAKGLSVPQALGFKIERKFLFYRCDILVEQLLNTQDLANYLRQKQLNSNQWQQIGALIAKMHELKVFHSDLNAHNILLQTNPNNSQSKFYLIDFDKCFILKNKNDEQLKLEFNRNLARLKRSFDKEKKLFNINFSQQNFAQLELGYVNYLTAN